MMSLLISSLANGGMLHNPASKLSYWTESDWRLEIRSIETRLELEGLHFMMSSKGTSPIPIGWISSRATNNRLRSDNSNSGCITTGQGAHALLAASANLTRALLFSPRFDQVGGHVIYRGIYRPCPRCII